MTTSLLLAALFLLLLCPCGSTLHDSINASRTFSRILERSQKSPIFAADHFRGFSTKSGPEVGDKLGSGLQEEEILSDANTYDALMAFYQSTIGDSWTFHWNWGNRTVSACRWYGVCCNASAAAFSSDDCFLPDWETGSYAGSCCGRGGNATNLYLPSNQLSGTIPPELGRLSSLQAIFLYLNQLSGTIPPELGQLLSLQNLDLDSNQLSGTIPPELGRLSSLQTLTLQSNQLDGTISHKLGQLSDLQLLSLYSNQLSGTIPPELGQLTNLQFLGLFSNQLSGTIPPELGKLANLQNLGLYSNKLCGTIPPTMEKLKSLHTLYLYSNQLSGTIPPELGQMVTLRGLDLSSNHFGGIEKFAGLVSPFKPAKWSNSACDRTAYSLGGLGYRK